MVNSGIKGQNTKGKMIYEYNYLIGKLEPQPFVVIKYLQIYSFNFPIISV